MQTDTYPHAHTLACLLALFFIYDVIIFVRALLSPFFFFFFFFFFYFQVTTNRPIPPTTHGTLHH